MFYEASVSRGGHCDGCPTCGGPAVRRKYGEVYGGWCFDADGVKAEIRGTPPEGFADPVFLDPLTQYFNGGLYRMWPSERYLARGGKRLHRDVWAAAFGPIPKDCHIHHRDSRPINNGLANLECMPDSEHLSLTWHATKDTRGTGLSAHARERAAEWHGSEEGRLWHSRHALRSQGWTKWRREQKPCQHCGKEFAALVRNSGHSQKFCGTLCKAAAHRARSKSL